MFKYLLLFVLFSSFLAGDHHDHPQEECSTPFIIISYYSGHNLTIGESFLDKSSTYKEKRAGPHHVVMDNHINSIQKSEKWVLCGNSLKNVEFDQYLYIDYSKYYKVGVSSNPSNVTLVFDKDYAPGYTVIRILTEICPNDNCVLTTQNLPAPFNAEVFIAPILPKDNYYAMVQDYIIHYL